MNWDTFHQFRAKLGRPLVMAHRGASALLPENTLSAFQRAIADGTDVIETDLHFTRDGEIVVIHDDTLNRTTTGAGRVRDMTLREIKQVPIKQPPERQNQTEYVPTLAELIDLTGEETPLVLELKDNRFAEPDYAKKFTSFLETHGLLEECAVISFDAAKINAVRQAAPALAGGIITLTNPLPTLPFALLGPFWPLLLLNPLYVRWAHRLGKIVAPLDPSPESRLGLYLKLDVDVLLTDNPKLTLSEIARRQ